MRLSRASTRWHVFPDRTEVVERLAASIAEQARHALAARARYLIVLAGGETPGALYRLLRDLDTDWSRWEIYFGDERCLSRGDPGRNDTMAGALWLGRVGIPLAQIHSIPAELGASVAALRYSKVLADVGRFDTTLLGLGEDGHTASLFPGQPIGAEVGSPDVLAVHGAPKPPGERVSLTARRLAAAAHVELLALGEAKREALHSLREGADVPITAIVPGAGLDVWVDGAAAGTLSA
ncbi:MAG TPA: 6-phosphogluconolactonase [Gammaproteobacteria bacterium]|nr:6-phosphogluconolactonase [Gammaproteobacteria bacterium]